MKLILIARDKENNPLHAVKILVVRVSKLKAVTPPKSARVSIEIMILPPMIQGMQLGIRILSTTSVVVSPMVFATGHCPDPTDSIALDKGIVR